MPVVFCPLRGFLVCAVACKGLLSVGRCLFFLDTAYWSPVAAVEPAFLASSRRFASHFCLLTLCLSRHTSHLVWPGMA